MDLVLRPALHHRKGDFLRRRGPLSLLFVYEEAGFVNSAMELLRTTLASISEPVPLVCAVWQLDIITEPLLRKVAALEAEAADMIIFVLHGGNDGLPRALNDWLRLWFWSHLALFAVTEGFPTRFDQCPRKASRLEKVGQSGKMDLLTIGGTAEPILATFKSQLTDALASQADGFSTGAGGLASTAEGSEPTRWRGRKEEEEINSAHSIL